MLRLLGSAKKLCDGLTRRDMLWAGSLALGNATLSDLLRVSASPRPAASGGFGKAKSCILLYLYGAASQLEWADMKPDAPVEIRGEFQPIRSRLVGGDVCEGLPNLARVMDKVTVVRSMTHPHPLHGVAYALTGVPTIDGPMELNPRDSRHWPFVGSVVDYLGRQTPRPGDAAPDNVALPFPFSSQRVGEVPRAGPYAAFLGAAYNPVWAEFRGQATRTLPRTLNDQKLDVADPYLGVSPESRFGLAGLSELPADVTLDRLDRRRSLMQQVEQARRDLDGGNAGQSNDRYRQMALSLMQSRQVRQAFDLGREPDRLRASYGMTLFGQAALTARRLVEAGSRFVSVFWDEYGLAGSGWDTHWSHYPRMRDELLPGLDSAFAGLVDDLDQRGLLDETLVLCLTEHGRTPKINTQRDGGRDHWSRAYTCMFAGGGVARGRVVGRTDRIGGTVTDRPVSPKDVLATVYHLLGFDPRTELTDRLGRPLPLVADGHVVGDMLA